jgi:peroxiredoxin
MVKRQHDKHQVRIQTRKSIALLLAGSGLLILGLTTFVLLLSRGDDSGAEEKTLFEPANVNYLAPDIQLENLEGDPVSLSDWQGNVVLLNNWATWCPPCKAEMPTLQSYFEDHQDQGFMVVAIEAGEPASDVAQFAINYSLTFTVLPDPSNNSLVAFHNFSLPNSYVIDRDGLVRLAWNGEIDRANLEKYVTPLVEEK